MSRDIRIKRTAHPLYYVWMGMKQRCYNKNYAAYHNYGGRGVKVCVRWLNDFYAFAEDMGEKPSSIAQIDRINNDGNYEPDNCRWTTPIENTNNQRRHIKVTVTPEEYKLLREMCGRRSTPTRYFREIISKEIRQHLLDKRKKKMAAKRKEK